MISLHSEVNDAKERTICFLQKAKKEEEEAAAGEAEETAHPMKRGSGLSRS